MSLCVVEEQMESYEERVCEKVGGRDIEREREREREGERKVERGRDTEREREREREREWERERFAGNITCAKLTYRPTGNIHLRIHYTT